MKRIIFLVLIFALTACGPAPVAQPPAPTQPPVVVEVTVVVPATSAPAPATEVPPPAAPAAVVENPPTATLPPAVGADQLINITKSGDNFSLRCSPSQIVFTATSVSTYITEVEIWYRMVDKVTGMSSQWYAGGKMDKDGQGNFTRTFSALDINTDVRARDSGWFEYQFVATGKDGNVVWRSEKFEKLINYTKECP
jgi:hypothetical protein